jgi:hypothetical protein
MFVNRGASDGYDERKVAALILEAAGRDPNDGEASVRVELRRTHAFVETQPALADAAIASSQRGLQKEEKPVTIERARTR